jgi:hypothetical protein
MLTEAQRRRLEELYSKVEQANWNGKLDDFAREHGFDAREPLTDAEKAEFRQLHLVLWGRDGRNV